MLHRELLVEAIDRFLGAGSLEDHGIVLPDGNGVLAVGGIGLHHVRARDVAGNLDVAGCRLIAGLRSDQRIVLGLGIVRRRPLRGDQRDILGGITSGVGQSVLLERRRGIPRRGGIRLGTRVIQHAARHGLQQLTGIIRQSCGVDGRLGRLG